MEQRWPWSPTTLAHSSPLKSLCHSRWSYEKTIGWRLPRMHSRSNICNKAPQRGKNIATASKYHFEWRRTIHAEAFQTGLQMCSAEQQVSWRFLKNVQNVLARVKSSSQKPSRLQEQCVLYNCTTWVNLDSPQSSNSVFQIWTPNRSASGTYTARVSSA